jgi:hypothetical protein
MRLVMLEGSTDDSRLWRNNVGRFELKDGRWIQTGLCVGSADTIGFHSVAVTPEMVGQRVAIFTAIETKSKGEKPDAHQKRFLDLVRDAGGIQGVAYQVRDLKTIVNEWLRHIGATP